MSMEETVEKNCAHADESDAQLKGVTEHGYLRFEEIRHDALVDRYRPHITESKKR
jgi:hypothetical protein